LKIRRIFYEFHLQSFRTLAVSGTRAYSLLAAPLSAAAGLRAINCLPDKFRVLVC